MVFPLVVRLMLLLSLLIASPVALTEASPALTVASPAVSNPDCQDTCGNVSIPFPFGIGAGCYFNDDFAITCDNSSKPSKPFFTSNNANLEVRNISIYGTYDIVFTVEVLLPVLAYDCPNGRTNHTNHQLVNLSRHFGVSADYNVFTATGCNYLASMRNQGGKIIGGCSSFCSDGNSTDGSCYGNNCCQTSIPSSLNFINISLTTGNNDSKTNDDCKYVFIVQQSELNGLLSRYPNYDMQKIQRVPVMLDWGMLGECNQSAPASYSLCGPNAYCIQITNFTYQCGCHFGDGANPYLTYGCPEPNWMDKKMDKKKTRIIIIGISTGIIGILLLLGGTWWLYKFVNRRKKLMLKQKFFKRNGGLLLQQQLSSGDEGNVEKTKLFTLKELEKATDRFNENRILGQGGQGTVYKGMLIDGRIVAIKKSKIVDEGNLEQFINEVVILSQINHRNVVKLHGCCLEAEVPLLVYEYIPNGTLYKYIHEQNEEFPLTWDIRVRIATEVAGAVSYLHSAASMPIYHRDIKSTNILLDEKFKAKVSDFGTSKSVSIDQTHMTTLVQGTFGYLDPEYFQSSQFTEKSDVYSFGVVLVELLTGKKPISATISEECRSLATYFILTMKENRLFDILDARVSTEGGKDEIMRVANLAKRCLNLSGRKRPTMKEVAIELEGIRMSYAVSIIQQTCEEVEYAENELTGFWDAPSTSTGSCLDNNVSSSLDVQPLLFN